MKSPFPFSPGDMVGRPIGLPYADMKRLAAQFRIPTAREVLAKAEATLRDMKTRSAPAPKASTPAKPRLVSGLAGCAIRYNDPVFSYKRGEGSAGELPLVFRPGVFDESTSEDVLLVASHEWSAKSEILARTSDGSLDLQGDNDKGVYFTARLFDNARPAIAEIRSGKLIGCSIGFDFIRSHIGDFHGLRAQIVTRASLGHIALSGEPACKASWLKLSEN